MLKLSVRVGRLVGGWPQLESIVLQAYSFDPVPAYNNLFTGLHKLRRVHFEDVNLLSSLPSTVKDVQLDNYTIAQGGVDESSPGVPALLRDHLAPIAPRLTHLSFNGSCLAAPDRPVRGYHSELIGSLRDIRRLSIPAFAVADLAAALSPLTHLEELEVFAKGRTKPRVGVEAEELVQLLLSARALCKVTVAEAIGEGWSDEGRRAVWHAAERRGVELVGVE